MDNQNFELCLPHCILLHLDTAIKLKFVLSGNVSSTQFEYMHECFQRIEKEIEWTKRNANHNDNQEAHEEEEEEDEEEEERAEAVAAQREKVST